jgi:hypothetical protein
MKNSSNKTLYYITTATFALWLVGDGIAGVLQADKGIESMVLLEYPLYLLYIVGGAKILAAIALIQTKCRKLTEWAYAGYIFTCVGASLSWYFSEGSLFMVMLPWVFAVFAFFSYRVWNASTH